MLKSAFFGAALVLGSTLGAGAQSIGGTYAVAGTNFDGSAYSGTADIVMNSKNCLIHWTTGGSESQGICMQNQNAFAASYILGKQVGLVVYQVMQNGSLEGVWTIAGQAGSGTEVLTPQ